MQHMGLPNQGNITGGMNMNLPMYTQQSLTPQQTQLSNNLSSLSRVMMPQSASNPTTSRMNPRISASSPIRNVTQNTSMMMNGPMGIPMEVYYTIVLGNGILIEIFFLGISDK